ncbi:MAG: hypothetical protein R3C52_00430 [Hyphomonadaceae bacterium]
MKLVIALAAAAGLFAPIACADDVTDADAAPFIGAWMIAFPDDPGVIVNRPDATCENPAVIERVDEHRIHVRTPGGDMGEWDVKAFDGRNPWWRDDGMTLVTEWRNDDAFLLAGKDFTGVRTDWKNAKQWTRCAATGSDR